MSRMFDIPVDKIILAPQPYLIDSYKTKWDRKNTMIIFAEGGYRPFSNDNNMEKDEFGYMMRETRQSTIG